MLILLAIARFAVTAAAGLALAGCAPGPLPDPRPPLEPIPQPPGAGDFAFGRFESPLTVSDAEQILIRTKIFAFGAMGPKRQVHAFNVLLEQPDARTRFRRVAAEADVAGQLYALCASLLLADADGMVHAEHIVANDTPILMFDHDMVESATPARVLARIWRRDICRAMRAERQEVMRLFDETRATR